MNTLPLEAETRILIDRNLENLGWKLKGKDKNVFFEQPKTELERKKLGGKRPDYVLYSKESEKPLIVIEAKKKGSRIDEALEQGIGYARAIDAPLVFATDGVFCKAFHTGANRPPILNGEEIDEFIREALALRYLTSYEVNTVSTKVQYDRKELIREISRRVTAIKMQVRQMTEARKVANHMDNYKDKAFAYEETVRPYLESIRDHIDHLEMEVDDEIWPLPKYRELLFTK